MTTALCAAHARKVALSAQSAKATANTLSMPTNASAELLSNVKDNNGNYVVSYIEKINKDNNQSNNEKTQNKS